MEELREDVISRQCRVNMSDVEGMALMLSTVTKTFGELKGWCATIYDILYQYCYTVYDFVCSRLHILVKSFKF